MSTPWLEELFQLRKDYKLWHEGNKMMQRTRAYARAAERLKAAEVTMDKIRWGVELPRDPEFVDWELTSQFMFELEPAEIHASEINDWLEILALEYPWDTEAEPVLDRRHCKPETDGSFSRENPNGIILVDENGDAIGPDTPPTGVWGDEVGGSWPGFPRVGDRETYKRARLITRVISYRNNDQMKTFCEMDDWEHRACFSFFERAALDGAITKLALFSCPTAAWPLHANNWQDFPLHAWVGILTRNVAGETCLLIWDCDMKDLGADDNYQRRPLSGILQANQYELVKQIKQTRGLKHVYLGGRELDWKDKGQCLMACGRFLVRFMRCYDRRLRQEDFFGYNLPFQGRFEGFVKLRF